jgi:chromosome partitioning protein
VKTLAIYHIKGGVGKTTTAVNLSYLSSRTQGKTLVCDLDPQSSATYFFRVKPKAKGGVKSLVKGGERFERSIKGTDYENLDLLPADFSYRNLDVELDGRKQPEKKLAEVLAPCRDQYQVVFLDCPPTINIVAENVFHAADEIVVPVVPTTLSVRTFDKLLDFLDKHGYGAHKVLAFHSMVETRKNLHREIMDRTSRRYQGMLASYIPYLSEIEKMGINRQPVCASSPVSAAAAAYERLWGEIRALVFAFS